MNIKVVDAQGHSLAQQRNIERLLEEFKGKVSESVQQQAEPDFYQGEISRWNFGELPALYQFEQAGVTVTSYPALTDKGDSVAIELMDYSHEAELATRKGVVRLLMLQLPQQLKQLRKDLLNGNQINLQLAGLSEQRKEWLEDLLEAVCVRVFLADGAVPKDERAFKTCLEAGRSELMVEAVRSEKLLLEIAAAYTGVRKALKKANQLAWATATADINQQLSQLFTKGFIADTPWQQLQHYPRYINAIAQRIDKLRGSLPRDRQLNAVLNDLCAPLYKVWQGNQQALRQGDTLFNYRWLLEEFRVSLFAQALGTSQPVSEKRLRKLLAELRDAQLISR